MRILNNEYFSFILSLNTLAFYFRDVLRSGDFRMIVIYYEGNADFVASMVIQEISFVDQRQLVWAIRNLDSWNGVSRQTDISFGNDILNIFICKNIISNSTIRRIYGELKISPRFYNMFLSLHTATDDGITSFFKRIWRHHVLNAALIFWKDVFRIYKHLPFEHKFQIKVFDSSSEKNQSHHLPPNIFEILFKHNDDHLGNTTFKVFVKENPPKIVTVPGRFRVGSKFYFIGSDGLFARDAEKKLVGHWRYISLPRRFRFVKFRDICSNDSIVPRDAIGNIIPPDDAPDEDVYVLNFTRKFKILWVDIQYYYHVLFERCETQ